MTIHALKGIAVIALLLAGLAGIVVALFLGQAFSGWQGVGLLALVGVPSAAAAIFSVKYIMD